MHTIRQIYLPTILSLLRLFGQSKRNIHIVGQFFKNCQIRSYLADRNYLYGKGGIIRLRIKNRHVMMCFTVSNVSVFKGSLTALGTLPTRG